MRFVAVFALCGYKKAFIQRDIIKNQYLDTNRKKYIYILIFLNYESFFYGVFVQNKYKKSFSM